MDFADDILDLDKFDITEDEESWLYSSPVCNNNVDLSAWLRQDVDRLPLASRQSLSQKLEHVMRDNPGSDSVHSNRGHSAVDSVNLSNLSDSVSSLPLSLTEDDRCIAADSYCDANDFFECSASDSCTSHELSSPSALCDIGMSPCPKGTLDLPVAFSKAGDCSNERATHILSSSPPPADPQVSHERSFSSGSDQSHGVRIGQWLAPELNSDLEDIHMLASMQEEDLRRCLQDLRLNGRRRQKSESSGNLEVVCFDGSENGNVSFAIANRLRAQQITLKEPQEAEYVLDPKQTRLTAINTSTFTRSPSKGSSGGAAKTSSSRHIRLSASPQPHTATVVGRKLSADVLRVSPSPLCNSQSSIGVKLSANNTVAYSDSGLSVGLVNQKASQLQKSLPNLSSNLTVGVAKESASSDEVAVLKAPPPPSLSPSPSAIPRPSGTRSGIARLRTGNSRIPSKSPARPAQSTSAKRDDWSSGCF